MEWASTFITFGFCFYKYRQSNKTELEKKHVHTLSFTFFFLSELNELITACLCRSERRSLVGGIGILKVATKKNVHDLTEHVQWLTLVKLVLYIWRFPHFQVFFFFSAWTRDKMLTQHDVLPWFPDTVNAGILFVICNWFSRLLVTMIWIFSFVFGICSIPPLGSFRPNTGLILK